MRVRRASESARRTQIQLPIRIVQSNFFAGVNSLVSAHDGRTHALVRAKARGGLNTIKAEIPEIEPMTDPVLRLESAAKATIYQAFDGASVLGQPIRQAMLNGFGMSPPVTFKTVDDQTKATWWRFI
jgi:hemin uptake protein HemP